VFKAKKSDERWTLMWFDESGKRKKKLCFVSKKDTERLGMKLEEQARAIRAGLISPKERAYKDHEAKPLSDHLKDYGRYLVNKGCCDKHADSTVNQVKYLIDFTKATKISELSFSKVTDAIKSIQDAANSLETANHYARSIKAFCRWLWKDARARDHVLVHIEIKSSESDRRRRRRAMTPDEAAKLVQAAEHGKPFRGLSGPDRAILYSTAINTGFRANELRSLTPERFDLDSTPPVAVCLAGYTKNGDEARQPLPMSLVERLRPWLASKELGQPVFGRITLHTAIMLRGDLAAAGIPYETSDGVVDFHSLRGCYISYLVASGASVKTCQTLARHSDPKLTIGIYAKASRFDLNSAVEALPDLTPASPATESQALRATGTDCATPCATFDRNDATDESAQVAFRIHNPGDLRGVSASDIPSALTAQHWVRSFPRYA
jgi:integrase